MDTPPECFYNADQNFLCYQKLPNSVYVDEANKHYYFGVNQMKDKTRCTLMVGTSASGENVTCYSWETEKIQNNSNLQMAQGHPFHTKTKQIIFLIEKSHYGGSSMFSGDIASAVKEI